VLERLHEYFLRLKRFDLVRPAFEYYSELRTLTLRYLVPNFRGAQHGLVKLRATSTTRPACRTNGNNEEYLPRADATATITLYLDAAHDQLRSGRWNNAL
jgi:hypothetical protein